MTDRSDLAYASAPAVPKRRFAPVAGFLSGASYVEVTAGRCELVWCNGSRVACPDVTLARALRLVARGTWVELPAPRARARRTGWFPSPMEARHDASCLPPQSHAVAAFAAPQC